MACVVKDVAVVVRWLSEMKAVRWVKCVDGVAAKLPEARQYPPPIHRAGLWPMPRESGKAGAGWLVMSGAMSSGQRLRYLNLRLLRYDLIVAGAGAGNLQKYA